MANSETATRLNNFEIEPHLFTVLFVAMFRIPLGKINFKHNILSFESTDMTNESTTRLPLPKMRGRQPCITRTFKS